VNANLAIAARHIDWGDAAKDGLLFVGIEETLNYGDTRMDNHHT
jgi:hypothetical protein